MKKYEYTWDECNLSIINRATILSSRGSEGWELVNVIQDKSGVVFYWKREIIEG